VSLSTGNLDEPDRFTPRNITRRPGRSRKLLSWSGHSLCRFSCGGVCNISSVSRLSTPDPCVEYFGCNFRSHANKTRLAISKNAATYWNPATAAIVANTAIVPGKTKSVHVTQHLQLRDPVYGSYLMSGAQHRI